MKVINNKKDLLKINIKPEPKKVEPSKKLTYPIIIKNKKDLRKILATGLKKGQC